jgi:hypothetical protein
MLLTINLATASTRYVDGIRMQSGGYTDAYGYSYSATDSIRLESTGSVNIVNDYGRVDITNRKQGDLGVGIDIDTATFLAPTVRFIATSRDGSAVQGIPAEVTTVSSVQPNGSVPITNNSLFLHSGSLYSMEGEADQTLVTRKRRAARMELVSNTNELAGPLTGNPDPTTEIRLNADSISLTGPVNATSQVAASHIVAKDRLSVGELEFGQLRGLGTFADYDAFAEAAAKNSFVAPRSSDFVSVDGTMFTVNDVSDNYLVRSKFMQDDPASYGWIYTGWDPDGVDDAFGFLSAPNAAFITSPETAFGETLEEVYVQASIRTDSAVTENGYFKVFFFNASNIQQGPAVDIDNGVQITSEFTTRGAFVTVPNSTVTKAQLFFTTAAGGNIYVTRPVLSGSDRKTHSNGFSVTIGQNVVSNYLIPLSGLSITSGAAILTSSSAMFDAGMVNKVITVDGAGVDGATLSTTVLTYTSPTQVTLAANAGTTVASTGTGQVGNGPLFSTLDLGRRIKVGNNVDTTITGVISESSVFVADNATETVTAGSGVMYDPYHDKKFLKPWKDAGNIQGPAGPPTEWTVTAESVDSTVPPEAIVSGDAPNNTLHLKIPAGPATFAQVNTAAPIARAEGDMWFDTSRPPTVPALLVSSKEFTDGIKVYNTTQNNIVASIGSDGKASFTANGGLATLNSSYWATYSTTYDDARYYKDAAGVVHLSGMVRSLVNIDLDNSANRIFLLPVGFRPTKRILLQCAANVPGGQGFCRVDVYADGSVVPVSALGFSNAAPSVATYSDPADSISVAWVSLNGIVFQALA